MNLLVFLTFLFANSNLLKVHHKGVSRVGVHFRRRSIWKFCEVTALQKSGGKTSVGGGKVDKAP
jgi:hypothetical protein